MAKRFQVLDSFSHISNSISAPIHALVSVQYPQLSGLQSLQDSINSIFKKKGVEYAEKIYSNLFIYASFFL